MNRSILNLKRWGRSHVRLTSIKFDGKLRKTRLKRWKASLLLILSNLSHITYIPMSRVHY